jgi:hypothetical protein
MIEVGKEENGTGIFLSWFCHPSVSCPGPPGIFNTISPIGGRARHAGLKRDQSEFMVRTLQIDDVYRESILGVAGKQVLTGERLARVAPTLVSM